MNSQTAKSTGPESAPLIHLQRFPQFVIRCLRLSTDGSFSFYVWMTVLTAIALVGFNAYAHQMANGMGITAMTDHVSWGMYISNFTYLVGLAAGAVTMVIPAYLYKNKELHEVVIVGEILAISAIVMAIAFVSTDIGHPERLWHMLPMIGDLNWPESMLSWDVIVLSGYLIINLHVVGYVLYSRYNKREPNTRYYMPVVFVSIFWAITIHTITAFLFSGLGGRPFWNSAVLAPRFIASAFVSGPAFIILALQIIPRFMAFPRSDGAIKTLVRIMRITILLNLFLHGSELFSEFYAGGKHSDAARYLYLGLHGHHELVPWIWTAIVFNAASGILVLYTAKKHDVRLINAICILSLIGIWIEKGMGLIVPGFVPTTLHEVVPYTPNIVELKITMGIWALGLLLFTIGIKIAVTVISGKAVYDMDDHRPATKES